MKIIISPAKTVSKKIESLNNKENFHKKTYEILERVPQVRLSNELFKVFYMYDGLCFKNITRLRRFRVYRQSFIYSISLIWGTKTL